MKTTAPPATPGHVWIELQRPASTEEATLRCHLANRMLTRLNGGAEPSHLFGWDSRRKLYTYGNDMGYVTLIDRGTWLNLEYVGRPL